MKQQIIKKLERLEFAAGKNTMPTNVICLVGVGKDRKPYIVDSRPIGSGGPGKLIRAMPVSLFDNEDKHEKT